MQRFSYNSAAELVGAFSAPAACATNDYVRLFGDADRGWICKDRPHITGPKAALAAISEPRFDAGVSRVEAMLAQVAPPAPRNMRRVRSRGDSGDELSMPHVWSGELERAWSRTQRASSVGPARVLVAAEVSIPSATSVDVLTWRGVAALALASALVAAGYTVRLSAATYKETHDSAKTPYSLECVVMDCGEGVDLHRMASLLASGLLARGIVLAHVIHTNKLSVGCGVSYTRELKPEHLDLTGFDRCFIAGNEVKNQETAAKWLANAMAILEPAQEAA